ncbi:unnamed protein product [Polarella glacialis]|uniref:J domain-containing protein n=1 Tax=Polarella glacialis TaxID=89957 RepID=A0A813DKU2_POLGL|nr:unnamed protein product [Polarella glacialis]CAE8694043.1 unnamed protein product [Polarella glacialis]
MDAFNDQRPTTGAHRRLDAFNDNHSQRRLPYYEVLGVTDSASSKEIVRAFRKLSLKFHPDKPGGSSEKFQEINKAYKCLKDEDSRRKYNDCGFDEDNINTGEVDEYVDTFFGETARGVDGYSPDWQTGSIRNFNRINLQEVPLHMRDIVRLGLTYMISLDLTFENIILMQHSRVDILYLMVGQQCEGDLTQDIFESEESYTVTYYDNPLQPGIGPRWSDTNEKTGRRDRSDLPRRELNFEEYQRRQKHALAMLENGPPDPMRALEEKYRSKMLETEHKQHAIAAEKRHQAIQGQDIYEDDSELTSFDDEAEFQMQKKQEQEASAGSVPAEVADNSSPAGGVQDAAATVGSTELLSQAPGKATDSQSDGQELSEYSHGADKVMGLSSDGVLFVAQGGKLLRNEGPARPTSSAPETSQNKEGPLKPTKCFSEASQFSAPIDDKSSHPHVPVVSLSFQGCACCEPKPLWEMLRAKL